MIQLAAMHCPGCGWMGRVSPSVVACLVCDGEIQPGSLAKRPRPREATRHDDRRETCLACEHYGRHRRGNRESEGCGLLRRPCDVDMLRLDPNWMGPNGRNCFFSEPGPSDHLPTLAAPYVTAERLAADAKRLAAKVAHWRIRRIVGVPRSGMIAASIVASTLNLPLLGLHDGRLQPLGVGLRARQMRWPDTGWTLVIEDSSASGWSLGEVRDQLRDHRDLAFAAVYATPSASRRLRAWARILPLPHWFEWNLWGNDKLIRGFKMATDMDGVLCEDCPLADDDASDRYERFLRTVRPLVYPNQHPVEAIITARLEAYRPQTEAWLAKYGVRYKQLIMGPWKSVAERCGACIGTWKREQAQRIGSFLFVESDPHQARVISQGWDAPVICPQLGYAMVQGEGPNL